MLWNWMVVRGGREGCVAWAAWLLRTIGGFEHEVESPYTSMVACSNTSTAVAEIQCISLENMKRPGRA